MMKQRKVPIRSCTGCMESKPKKELIRIVRSPEGKISLDPNGKMPGRGAYICHSAECLKKARKTKRLEKSLSCEISDEIYLRLEQEISNEEGKP